MIGTRMAALVAAGALAVGLIVGAAGVMVAQEAGDRAPVGAGQAGHMQWMWSTMGGPDGQRAVPGMMGGPSGMMGGPSGMMGGPSGMMTLDRDAMVGWMVQHHGLATPEPSR